MTLALEDLAAVIFDFDGVLVESVDIKTQAFAALFEDHGPEVVRRVVEHHRQNGGVSRFEKLRHYHRDFLGRPLDDAELEALAQRFAGLVVDQVTAAPFVPGAERFLGDCSRRMPCFIVSGTPQQELQEIVRRRRMTSYFVDVLGAPTTKIENVRQILHAHGFPPGRVTFFGDADADWTAAVATGVTFVGVVRDRDNPLATRDGFQKIADFDELP